MSEKIKFYFIEVESFSLCIVIFRVNKNMPDPKVPKLSENIDYVEAYNKIHQYVVVEKHFLDKDISVNCIMRQCAVNKKTLNKILRQKEYMAFHSYINKQRIIYAATLLLDPSNKLIEVVASEVCFNNSRTFVRNFEAVYNMTPTEYRHRYGLKKT